MKIYLQKIGKSGKPGKRQFFGNTTDITAAAEKVKAALFKGMTQAGLFGTVNDRTADDGKIIIECVPACMLFEKSAFIVSVVAD